jgi:hypothetical protein
LSPKVGLVVLDNLVSTLASPSDAHKDSHVRSALPPLKRVAEETGATIIGIGHLNKSIGARSALQRGMGSIAFQGVARSVLLVARDPANPQCRVLALVKNNLGALADSLAFRLEPRDDYCRVIWEGPRDISADDLVGETIDENRKLKRTSDFLREYLAAGPRWNQHVIEASGASEMTLRRAREQLGVESKKVGKKWYWFFPPFDESKLLKDMEVRAPPAASESAPGIDAK